MSDTDRRFALALGLSALGGVLAIPRPAAAQPYRPDEGQERAPGVRMVLVSERSSMAAGGRDAVLPGYRSLRVEDYPVLFTNAGENWRQFPDFPLLATDELDSLPRHMRHPLGETPPTQLIKWLF